jgi:hypothetical protein
MAYSRIDSTNINYHYIKILLFFTLLFTFCIIIFTILVFINLVPSIPSPFLVNSLIKKTVVPTVYERYCNVLGGPCDSVPPIGFVIPPYYGGAIDAALSSQGNYVISIVGTDNEVGYKSTNPNTRSFVSLIKIALQSEYGIGGDGLLYAMKSDSDHSLYNIGVYIEPTHKDWNLYYGAGPGAGFISVNNTNIAKALFYGRGSQLSILFGKDCYNDPKRTFTVQIDDSSSLHLVGALNPLGCNNSMNTTSGYWATQRVLTTTNDYHTVLVTTTGSQNGQLVGVRFTNPTGVVVDNYSRRGLNNHIYEWENGNWYWGSKTTPIYQDSNTATRWSGAQSDAKADLVLYFVSIKDFNLVSVLFDKITANIVLPLRYFSPNVDIAIVFPIVDICDTVNEQQLSEWTDFVTRLSDWCYQYNIATVNLALYFRNYTTTTFESSDNAITNLQRLGVYDSNIQWPDYSDKLHSLIAQALYPLTKNSYR